MKKVKIIGITGGSASGKTLISQKIDDAFENSESVIIIRQDDYYKNLDHMTFEERLSVNFDHPDAFDMDLLIEHLISLKNRNSIKKPLYDFVEYTRAKEIEVVNPVDVIIIEGLFILENPLLRNLCDIRIFVDTDADIRFIRRLNRDLLTRGRSVESVINQYVTTVKQMHDLFVEPCKKYADIIIPKGGENEIAINLLINEITSLIKGE